MNGEKAFRNVMMFIKSASFHATITRKKGVADFLSSRITQAATQPDLQGFGERLAASLGTELDHCVNAFTSLALAGTSPYAPRIVAWLRRYPQTAAQMAFVSAKSEDGGISPFDALLQEIDIEAILPSAEDADDQVASAAAWDIPIVAELLSPLAHGADSKSGNATLFRRMQALGARGNVLNIPFYAGNAVRGQMRDLLATHFLEELNAPAKSLSLWFFHLLYAGGALEEGSAATKALAKRCGDNGAIRAEGIRELRDMLPALSLLGGGIGNKIISGRVHVGDLRPRCREWGTGSKSAAQLMDWQFLTRRDDDENRSKDDGHHGMIANTETLMAGTVLDGGISVSAHASELEKSALGVGLRLMSERGFLGAENRRGFGKVALAVDNAPDEALYLEHLAGKREEILTYLSEIGAVVPAQAG